MAKSKLIVVDTDVASAAGDEFATDERAKLCHDLLMAILNICHRILISTTAFDEWNRHRSNFARRWIRQMFARRKLQEADVPLNESLRSRIEKLSGNPKELAAMRKDCHLLEAALRADQIVISLDKVSERLFRFAAEQIKEIRAVNWLDPMGSKVDMRDWLNRGAPDEPALRLGDR